MSLRNKIRTSSTRQTGGPITRRRRGVLRSGAAAVEAAIIIPIVIIPIMMGTLEICAGLYLKESLTICAFEGVRIGTRREGTAEAVLARVQEVLDDRQIDMTASNPGVGITIDPPDFSGLDALDPITVTIVAPTAGNSIFIFDHLANRNVSASVTMVREFDN